MEHLYDALHPGVIRLIQMTISAAHRHRKPISICGEMCSEPRFVRLLLLLGLDHFSMPPQHILRVKKIVRDTNTRELRTLMTQHQDSDWQRRVDLINRA